MRSYLLILGLVVVGAAVVLLVPSSDGGDIEGVFEIEHPRYDGTGAPPLPPDFGGDPELAPYLRASAFTEAEADSIKAASAEQPAESMAAQPG